MTEQSKRIEIEIAVSELEYAQTMADCESPVQAHSAIEGATSHLDSEEFKDLIGKLGDAKHRLSLASKQVFDNKECKAYENLGRAYGIIGYVLDELK